MYVGDSFNASLVSFAVVDPEVLPVWAKSRGIKASINAFPHPYQRQSRYIQSFISLECKSDRLLFGLHSNYKSDCCLDLSMSPYEVFN